MNSGIIPAQKAEHLVIAKHKDVITKAVYCTGTEAVFPEDAEDPDALAPYVFTEIVGTDKLCDLLVDPFALEGYSDLNSASAF